MMYLKLSGLKPGEGFLIEETKISSDMKSRLCELGFVRGTFVKCVGKAPMGDPGLYYIKNTLIALRNNDASGIIGKSA